MAEDLSETATETSSRRNMLGLSGKSVGAAAALAAAGIALNMRGARAATPTPAQIFSFALNFEYLGAEYYLRAVTGQGLPTTLTGGSSGNVIAPTNPIVPFQTPAVAGFAIRLASDEAAHVNFIRAVLGAAAPAEPTIDLGVGPTNSWSVLAQAAGLVGAGGVFNPYENEVTFLLGAYVLEDVCVTALAGAAALLVGTGTANIESAAGLLGVEGAQAGCIRGYLAQIGGDTATDAISALRAKLSGVGDVGTDYNSNPYNILDGNVQAQVFDRTPQQILNIAYGKAGTGITSGGFFPNGVAGSITST